MLGGLVVLECSRIELWVSSMCVEVWAGGVALVVGVVQG